MRRHVVSRLTRRCPANQVVCARFVDFRLLIAVQSRCLDFFRPIVGIPFARGARLEAPATQAFQNILKHGHVAGKLGSLEIAVHRLQQRLAAPRVAVVPLALDSSHRVSSTRPVR